MFSSGITSGFVSLSDKLLVRIIDRVNSPTICMKVEFLNVNKQTKSPIVGNQLFDLIQDRLYNGRPAWSNGGDTFLSYVPPPEDDDSSPGSWLVGNEPGVDSGFAYLKPKQDVFVPIGIEVNGGEQWHWLERSGWEKADDVRLVCKDEVSMGASHFFHVEYFDHGHATTTMLSPPSVNAIVSADVEKTYPQLAGKRFPSLSSASLWNADKEEWIPITNSPSSSMTTNSESTNKFNVMCHFGAPTMITDSLGVSTVGHLISQEHGENQSWKLTFRRIVKERLKWDTHDLIKTTEGIKMIYSKSTTAHFTYIPFPTSFSPLLSSPTPFPTINTSIPSLNHNHVGAIKPNNGIQQVPAEIDLESPAQEEILFNLDRHGQAQGGKKGNQRAKVTLRPLTDDELQKYYIDMVEPIHRVQKGHFLWVWYSTPLSYSTLNNPLSSDDSNMVEKTQVGVDGNVVSTSEMLMDTKDGTSMQRYRQQQQQQQQRQQQQKNHQSNPIVETSIEMFLGNFFLFNLLFHYASIAS